MQPSLTPHQDAMKRPHARDTRLLTDPVEAATTRALRAAEMEIAALLDAGTSDERIIGFCAAISASLLDSVASSAASVTGEEAPDPVRRAAMLQVMLSLILQHLAGGKPGYEAHEPVDASPAGRA